MIRPKQKARIRSFTSAQNRQTGLLLGALFLVGLVISWRGLGGYGMAAYFLLWAASYGVIFAGTCRYCAYYGTPCPIPLEGGLVHRFFAKKDAGFGFIQLAWAAGAYGLRAAVPVLVIIRENLFAWGAFYAGILILFWIVHLRIIGCPNCVNAACPLNPGNQQ
jgi:hypothetical protein